MIIPQPLIQAANNKSDSVETLPKISVDWQCHSKNVMSQGKCGSSHVISALETIEIGYKMFSANKVEELSVQDVLSCASQTAYPSLFGCKGGFSTGVFKYVQS